MYKSNRRIKTARRLSRKLDGISLFRRRTWYADAPPPATPPTPETLPGKSEDKGSDADPNWLAARLERAERAAKDKLLASLGLKDEADARAKLGASVEALTATQRFQQQLEDQAKLIKELTDANKQAEDERKQVKQRERDNAINDAIKKAVGAFANGDDVVMYARSNVDLSKAVKEDGSIDEAIITATVDTVRTARPAWFKPATPGSPSNHGGKPTDVDKKKQEEAATHQWQAIRRGG